MRGHIQRRDGPRGPAYSVVLELPPEDGKRRQRRLGTRYTKREAEALLREGLHELETGGLPEPHRFTVGQWLTQWLTIVESQIAGASYRQYEAIVRLHLSPAFGSTPLARLASSQIERQYRLWLDQGVAASTILGWHVKLHAALDKAVVRRLIRSNPAASKLISLPRSKQPATAVWTVEQAKQFLSYAHEDRLYALLRLAVETGLRRGELIALRWEDIDLDRASLQVTRTSTVDRQGKQLLKDSPKTKASNRRVSLSAGTVAALRAHRQQSVLVFVSERGVRLNASLINRLLTRLSRQAGVPVIRFHDLRHTHATLLLRAGENIKVIQERLGHANVSETLDRYSHVIEDMGRGAALKMDDLFG